MNVKQPEDQRVDVNFESHPPIESDLNGIARLLRQTLLQFVDCTSLANYLIELKDITQVIAVEEPAEENTDDDDEPDDDIYGVSSIIELPTSKSSDTIQVEARKQLMKFLKNKCPELEKILSDEQNKIGMVVNERYINLPPQLSLPTLKTLTQSLDGLKYTHLVFVSKVLLRSRHTDTKLPSKRSKSGQSSHGQESDAEPIVFVNPEEEVICEGADFHTDSDVSSYCDENATWSFNTDVKYIPHRRIMMIDYKRWPTILKNLEKELK